MNIGPQTIVLAVIKQESDSSFEQIFIRSGLKRESVLDIIGNLISHGYVVRKTTYSITKEGLEKLRKEERVLKEMVYANIDTAQSEESDE